MNSDTLERTAQGTPALHNSDERVRSLAIDVLAELPYDPNEDQMLLIVALCHFLCYSPARSVFLLGGFAGTGKTSLTGAIVRALTRRRITTVLMAPTGRAAHVLAGHSAHRAYTIHRKIYRQSSYGSDSFGIADNRHRSTLFIVDEASMINNGGELSPFGTGRLLDDLFTYVYGSNLEDNGNRLLLMGDTAQLPPVGQQVSPALDENVLQGYGAPLYAVLLKQVARQALESGILRAATLLRNIIESGVYVMPDIDVTSCDDCTAISSEFLLETVSDCYDRDGLEQTIIITRSNKRATLFNQGVRGSILYREDLLTTGDLLMVVKNNYYWATDYDELDFIANGDTVRVRRVRGDIEHRYGLQFLTVSIELPDHDNIEMEVKVVVDSLMSDTPALTREQQERLYTEVWNELPGDKRARYKALKQHPYFNALQVKYGYAVTCHKAQGGQWRNVFIDMGGIAPEAATTLDYHRWLYTAITRATTHVHLINYTPPDPD